MLTKSEHVTLHFIMLSMVYGEPGWRSWYSDSLWARQSGDQIIPMGVKFSAHVQTSSEAQPASYTVGTGSFPGLKQLGRGIDHPPPSSAEVKERVELYLWALVACSRMYFTFTLL